jgi:DNA-binding transcriptional regulator LsrR (DeoR family)
MEKARKTKIRASNGEENLDSDHRRSARIRHRVAWMYYAEEMTQNEIAEVLGVGRVTVARLLADAKALNEIKISLRHEFEELTSLESSLQRRFQLQRAIVAPVSSAQADPTPMIAAATGELIGEVVKPNMLLGVGWGRTLLKTLPFIDEADTPGLTVVSLLGGISAVKQYNPTEFAWRFSRLFKADCYLIAAPAVVDSPETKKALIERCGIGPVFELAHRLDAIILSVGSTSNTSTAQMFEAFPDEDRKSLIAAGAVGDVLFNFYDIHGRVVDHPANERVMSVPIPQLKEVPLRILTSGGSDKVPALLGALRMLRPQILVTDEIAARAILEAS